VSDRKPFLLRIDRDIIDALQRWADDDLRSLNGQIEFLLRKALKDAKRIAEDEERSSRVEARSAARWSKSGRSRTWSDSGQPGPFCSTTTITGLPSTPSRNPIRQPQARRACVKPFNIVEDDHTTRGL
jgi:hypothetical protein